VISNAASGVLRLLAEIDERGWDWTLDQGWMIRGQTLVVDGGFSLLA
jgi:hypothetical protein